MPTLLLIIALVALVWQIKAKHREQRRANAMRTRLDATRWTVRRHTPARDRKAARLRAMRAELREAESFEDRLEEVEKQLLPCVEFSAGTDWFGQNWRSQ